MKNLLVVCAYNNEEILNKCLLASDELKNGAIDVLLLRGKSSAALTYNSVIKRKEAHYLLFVHQDVYFPNGWFAKVFNYIDELNKKKVDWGVLGVAGINEQGQLCANLWSSGINRLIQEGNCDFEAVQSLDEVLLLVNAKHEVLFDEDLNGYHLYGTDIVQQMNQKGISSFVIDAPLIHDDAPKGSLGRSYLEGYRYIQSKWSNNLPIGTCCMEIGKTSASYYMRELKQFRMKLMGRKLRSVPINPRAQSKKLGFE